jgi:excisionase family DNA binding protein
MAALHDELLPIGKAAEILHVHVDTLRRWERRGAITAIRTPGKQRKFWRSDVEALLDTPVAS